MAFDYLVAIAAMDAEQRRCNREWDVFVEQGETDAMRIVERQGSRLEKMQEKYSISREWRDGVSYVRFAEMKND